jgi:hypothetical protein
MKQVVSDSSAGAWIESYYRETATELTGGTGAAVRGIPRLAAFPYGEPSWTKIQAVIEKYGMEGVVSWEDAMTDNIDVIAREMLRIARAVAYAVDSQIFSVLNTGAGNNVWCGDLASASGAAYAWNSATVANRDPVADILAAKRELYIDNFDPDGTQSFLILSPTDYNALLANSKVINNPTFKTADVVSNGRVGQIAGLTIIVSNVVTASGALVVIGKECGTWKSAEPLTSFATPDKGVKYTIRAYELGVCQLHSPNAVCKIQYTQK